MEYVVGNKVAMKKQHPCGANCWEIIRIGMDVKIKCCNCQRTVALKRKDFDKNLKQIFSE